MTIQDCLNSQDSVFPLGFFEVLTSVSESPIWLAQIVELQKSFLIIPNSISEIRRRLIVALHCIHDSSQSFQKDYSGQDSSIEQLNNLITVFFLSLRKF